MVYQPGPNKLYRGNQFVADYTSHAECIEAGYALNLAAGRTFRCAQSFVAAFVPDQPVDCVVSEWSEWTGGDWVPLTCPSSGVQTRDEIRSRTIITEAANGGTSCPALVETRTATRTCTPPSPPPTGAVVVSDEFNYVVDRLGSKAAFTAPGRWQGVKDQTTRAGANGYLYTAQSMPNCGPAPDGSRFLVMEGLPTTLGHQTDYYLQTPSGPNGTIPAAVKIAGEVCVESGDIEGQHNKIFYPLYGTRTDYPMSAEEQPGLIVQTSFYFRGSQQFTAPRDGCFVFTNLTTGTKARVEAQVSSGNGSKLTPNIDGVDPWICPNDWVQIEIVLDVSGPQGRFTTRYKRQGGDWHTVTDWQGGVTPGFTWPTTALDREGAKSVRTPTTQGPGTYPGPDRTQLWNRLSVGAP